MTCAIILGVTTDQLQLILPKKALNVLYNRREWHYIVKQDPIIRHTKKPREIDRILWGMQNAMHAVHKLECTWSNFPRVPRLMWPVYRGARLRSRLRWTQVHFCRKIEGDKGILLSYHLRFLRRCLFTVSRWLFCLLMHSTRHPWLVLTLVTRSSSRTRLRAINFQVNNSVHAVCCCCCCYRHLRRKVDKIKVKDLILPSWPYKDTRRHWIKKPRWTFNWMRPTYARIFTWQAPALNDTWKDISWPTHSYRCIQVNTNQTLYASAGVSEHEKISNCLTKNYWVSRFRNKRTEPVCCHCTRPCQDDALVRPCALLSSWGRVLCHVLFFSSSSLLAPALVCPSWPWTEFFTYHCTSYIRYKGVAYFRCAQRKITPRWRRCIMQHNAASTNRPIGPT